MFESMLFAVSWNDKGRSLDVNLPKNDRNKAARVDFLEPVLPMSAVTNFGS